MKKRLLALVVATVTLASIVSGCGAGDQDDKTIVIGASAAPHAEILAVAKPILEEQGYTVEIKEFTDYVLPNTALDNGELDANFFQHLPYLEDFNKEKGTKIGSAAAIHFEPFAIYPGKSTDLESLKEGAKIGVPNDTTNEARALLLLEAQGLIKVAEDAGLTATVMDIVDNPLKLEIVEIEAAQIARSLPDLDLGCINGNYALEGGVDLSTALATEATDSLSAETFANIIAVQEGTENDEKIKALVDAVKSEEVKTFINETYAGAVVPVF